MTGQAIERRGAASWEISIKDLAATIAKHVGYAGEVVRDTTTPNGQPRRALDVSRAKVNLGLEGQVPLVSRRRGSAGPSGGDSK